MTLSNIFYFCAAFLISCEAKRRNKYTGRISKKNPKYQNKELDEILSKYWPKQFYIDPYYLFRFVVYMHLIFGLRHFLMSMYLRNSAASWNQIKKNWWKKYKANRRDVLLYVGFLILAFIFLAFHQIWAFSSPYFYLGLKYTAQPFLSKKTIKAFFNHEVDEQPKKRGLYQLTLPRFLSFNILIAMFALVESFEKQKRKQKEADIKVEIELIKKNPDLTEKQKQEKIRNVDPDKDICRKKYGRLTQHKKFKRQMVAFLSFGVYSFVQYNIYGYAF